MKHFSTRQAFSMRNYYSYEACFFEIIINILFE